jgi:hypothetical protein
MWSRDKKRLTFAILLGISIFLFAKYVPLKHGIEVAFLSETGTGSVDDFIGKKIRVFCHVTQVTGAWWAVEGINVEGRNVFSIGTHLFTVTTNGNDPYLLLSEELTLYAHPPNRFVLEGVLEYDEAIREYKMTIEKWDIVLPIYPLDYRGSYSQNFLTLIDFLF